MNARSSTRLIGGVETHWREAGEGEPVVLLHGLCASSYSWRAVFEPLARRFRVLAPDLPGHGRSSAPLDFDYSLKGFSNWLLAFIDAAGFERSHLAGSSLGGVISVMTAMDAPSRIGRAALLGTPLYLDDGPPFLSMLRWPVFGRVLETLLGPGLVRIVGRTAYRDPGLLTEAAVAEYSIPLKTPHGRRAAAETIRRAIPSDAAERVARYCELSTEFLVICGAQDTVALPVSARRFCGKAPNARLLELPDCAHLPQEEKPEIVARALLEFFAHGR